MKTPVEPVFFLLSCLKLSGSLKEISRSSGQLPWGRMKQGQDGLPIPYLSSFLHEAGQGNTLITFYKDWQK